MTVKFETVVPAAMMPFDQLDPDTLLAQVGLVGRRCATNLAEDSRFLSSFCEDLEQRDLWRKIAPTWDEFCQKAFNHPSYYIDLIREGVALLDKGDGKPIPAEDAKKAAAEKREEKRKAAMAAMAAMVPALEKHGGERCKEQVGLPNLKTGNQNSEYLVARIKRDRPDIAERMVKGEFKSVNQAAREAGIQVRPSVKLGSPETVARSIFRLKGEEYVREMVAAIKHNATPELIIELRMLIND